MSAGTLKDLVLMTEKSANSMMPIWISIPGSVISGKLVSQGEMISRTTTLVTRNLPLEEQVIASITSLKVEDAGREYIQELESLENAHLSDVTIFHGDKIVRSPFAIVELGSVGAWGIGTISKDGESQVG